MTCWPPIVPFYPPLVATRLLKFLEFALLCTLLLERLFNFLGKFRFFPFHTFPLFAVVIVPEYLGYILLILEGFWGTKAVLGRILGEKGEVNGGNVIRDAG